MSYGEAFEDATNDVNRIYRELRNPNGISSKNAKRLRKQYEEAKEKYNRMALERGQPQIGG